MTNESPLPRVSLFALCVGLVLVAAPAAPQTQTGVISGTATDQAGAVLPGTTITIRSAQLIRGTQATVTRENGGYRFPTLPPGTYSVQFELSGFHRVLREGIRVLAGATATVDATLLIEGVAEEVTVTGDPPLIDVKSSATNTTWDEDLIQNIPTSRTFVDINHLLPGVEDGQYRDVGPGASVVNGGTTRDNKLTIDGQNVSNAYSGYPSTDLSYEVVQEVQAVTAGIAAEFGGASDGVFNVITKSGGNEFSGSAYGYYTDDSLQGENITDEQAAQGLTRGTTLDERYNYGVSLGGPIWRNHIWFFGNYDRKSETVNIINFPVPQSVNQKQYFGKITAQAGSNHTFQVLAQRADLNEFPFIPQSVFADDKVYRVQDHENRIYSAKYTGILGDNTYIQITGGLANSNRFQDFPNSGPDDVGFIDVATRAICCGVYRAVVSPGGTKTKQLNADLSHFVAEGLGGSHNIKVGVSWDANDRDEIRDWTNGARLHETLNGEPFRITLSNHPVDAKANVRTTGVFAQDQWTLGNVTLNIGARFDSSDMWLPEGSSGGRNFDVQTFPREDVGTLNMFSPRIGFAWDIGASHSTVVTANFGRYYEQVRPYIFEGVAKFAAGVRRWDWSDLNGNGIWDPGEEGDLNRDTTSTTSSEVDSDLKNTYWDTYTAGVSHEFGGVFSLSVTGVYRKENNIIETIDRSRPFDEAYVPVSVTNPVDNQPLTIYALRPEFAAIPSSIFVTNPDASFCSFCITPERNYKGLQFVLEKRLRDHWQLSASYALSSSEGNKGTHHRTWQGSLFSDPNNMVNSFGSTTLDRTHSFKVQGSYEAPADIWLSASYILQSGVPAQRDRGVLGPLVRFTRDDSDLIVVEGVIDVLGASPGESNLDARNLLDVRVEKRFQVGGFGFVSAILDVRNLFNDSSVDFFEDVLVGDSDFGAPGQLVFPRTVRLGARFVF